MSDDRCFDKNGDTLPLETMPLWSDLRAMAKRIRNINPKLVSGLEPSILVRAAQMLESSAPSAKRFNCPRCGVEEGGSCRDFDHAAKQCNHVLSHERHTESQQQAALSGESTATNAEETGQSRTPVAAPLPGPTPRTIVERLTSWDASEDKEALAEEAAVRIDQLERELAVTQAELDTRPTLAEHAAALHARSSIATNGASLRLLLDQVRREWYRFTGYSQLKADIDFALDTPNSSDEGNDHV